MGKKKCKASLDVERKNYDGVNKRAKKIIEGLYGDDVKYHNPPIALVDFTLLYNTSVSSTALAKNGGVNATTKRNNDNGALYDAMENKLVPYIDGLFTNDKDSIETAGMVAVDEFEKQGIPDDGVIKSITKGNSAHSVKVNLEPLTGSKKLKRSIKFYTVLVYDDALTETPVSSTQFTNSRKMFIAGIAFVKPMWYSITITNSAGTSKISPRSKFTLTD